MAAIRGHVGLSITLLLSFLLSGGVSGASMPPMDTGSASHEAAAPVHQQEQGTGSFQDEVPSEVDGTSLESSASEEEPTKDDSDVVLEDSASVQGSQTSGVRASETEAEGTPDNGDVSKNLFISSSELPLGFREEDRPLLGRFPWNKNKQTLLEFLASKNIALPTSDNVDSLNDAWDSITAMETSEQRQFFWVLILNSSKTIEDDIILALVCKLLCEFYSCPPDCPGYTNPPWGP